MAEKKIYHYDEKEVRAHILYLVNQGLEEPQIEEVIGEAIYAEVCGDDKEAIVSSSEAAAKMAEGANHDRLYHTNELSRTKSGLFYDEALTMETIRLLKKQLVSEDYIAFVIGYELYKILVQDKEEEEKEKKKKKKK